MNNAHIFDKEIKFFLKVAWYRKCHFQYQSLHHDISSLYNDNCHYYIPCTSVVYSYTHSHTNLLVRSRVWYSGLDEGFGTRLATTIHTHATCMYNTQPIAMLLLSSFSLPLLPSLSSFTPSPPLPLLLPFLSSLCPLWFSHNWKELWTSQWPRYGTIHHLVILSASCGSIQFQ